MNQNGTNHQEDIMQAFFVVVMTLWAVAALLAPAAIIKPYWLYLMA